MQWSELEDRVALLPEHTPKIDNSGPRHPLDDLAETYCEIPIQSNQDAVAAITLGLSCLGLDIEDNGPGECLLRRAVAYLRA